MDKLKYSELLMVGSKQVKHMIRGWMRSHNGQVHSACAIGMMAVARAGTLDNNACRDELSKLRRELVRANLKHEIIAMNDNMKLCPKEIAEKLQATGH